MVSSPFFNLKQAQERSKKLNNKKPNKGSEAAKVVISILNNEPKNLKIYHQELRLFKNSIIH